MAELLRTPLFGDSRIVAYYRMQGNSNDSSGSNNGSDTSMTYTGDDGIYGNGAHFNGTTGKILVPNASALNITGTVSLGAWIKVTDITTGLPILYKGYEAANQTRYSLAIKTTGAVRFRVVATAGRSEVTNTTLTNGTWAHVGVVCNINGGTNATFYINGIAASSTLDDGSAGSYANVSESNQMGIGIRSDSSGFGAGSIDDAFVANGTITAAEFLTLYQAGPSGASLFFI
jgi:hypothetical protein